MTEKEKVHKNKIPYDGWDKRPKNWEQGHNQLIDSMMEYRSNSPPSDSKKIKEYRKKKLDAIFVFIGDLKDDDDVHEWVIRRLDLAYQIYVNNKYKPKIICLGGGSLYKPPILNNNKYVIHESTVCADYLVRLGVNPKDVYREWGSYDTIANVYFAYTNFIYPMKSKKALVITSQFHLWRAETIFRWIISLSKSKCRLYVEPVYDDDLPAKTIMNMIKQERISLFNLKENIIPKIRTLKGFHRWFYEEHKAYCNHYDEDEKKHIDDDT